MIITGLARIGNDVEIRHTSGDDAVCNISLAFNYGKKGDDNKRPTQWIEASLWGKRAEALAQYLTKGTAVDVVLSEPHIETYQGKNGEGHKLVGRVVEIELAGGGGREQSGESQQSRPAPAQRPAASGNANGGFNDFSDDIPFAPIGRGAACHAI